jgi:hypothetical protein
LFRQVTSAFAGLVITVMPSNATASSTYSIPFCLQTGASSFGSIGREASLMSVSPSQNRTNPSPVPGPSTVIETSEDTSSLKSSATRLVIGCTVEDPEIVMVPLKAVAPVAPLAPVVEPVSPPPSSSLQAAATSASTAIIARTSRTFLRFPIRTSL